MQEKFIERERIFFRISPDQQDLIALVKMKPGKCWHPEPRLWSLPDTPENRSWAGLDSGPPVRHLKEPATVQSPAETPPQPPPGPALGPGQAGAVAILEAGRIYYKIDMARIERRAAIKRIDDCQWHPDRKAWSVPDTPDNRLKIKAIHGMSPPDTHAQGSGVQMSVRPHPESPQWICLDLPLVLMPEHLQTVKNIHGRRWNQRWMLWELPYTQLTLRFLRKYFNGMLRWDFVPDEGVPERLGESEKTGQGLHKPSKAKPARYEAAVVALEQCLLLKRYHQDVLRERGGTRQQSGQPVSAKTATKIAQSVLGGRGGSASSYGGQPQAPLPSDADLLSRTASRRGHQLTH